MSAKDMTEELMKAQVLVESLPYIQKFNRLPRWFLTRLIRALFQ